MKNLIRNLDWKNHLFGMLASIIGIFIGLNLEESQRNREQRERLEAYRVLIDNEVNENINEIQAFMDKSYCYEELSSFFSSHLDESIEEARGLITLDVSLSAIDSLLNKLGRKNFNLLNLEGESNEDGAITIFIEEITNNSIKAGVVFRSFDCKLQSTIWDSFKSTDLVNTMEPNEIFKYSSIYKTFDLITRDGDFDEPINKIQKVLNDIKLNELMKKERYDHLHRQYYNVNLFVDQKLKSVKSLINKEHQMKDRIVFERVY